MFSKLYVLKSPSNMSTRIILSNLLQKIGFRCQCQIWIYYCQRKGNGMSNQILIANCIIPI